jgi:hypothetical protein
LPGQAPFQQIERGIELIAFVGILLNGRTRCADALVNLIHQSLKTRQAGGIGNACAAEKHHAAFFVRLQEGIGNIGAVSDKLHGRSVLQRPAPDHLPRHLLFAIIAYRIQIDRFGDLDHETRQLLDRIGPKESSTAMAARLVSFDQKRTELTPGTVLAREWDRRSQRVMVMSDGFAWNGQTYDSLSKVAFAITGTNWNGPRFFGLRGKEDRLAMGEARS